MSADVYSTLASEAAEGGIFITFAVSAVQDFHCDISRSDLLAASHGR